LKRDGIIATFENGKPVTQFQCLRGPCTGHGGRAGADKEENTMYISSRNFSKRAMET
jgi:hypothetical protein